MPNYHKATIDEIVAEISDSIIELIESTTGRSLVDEDEDLMLDYDDVVEIIDSLEYSPVISYDEFEDLTSIGDLINFVVDKIDS
jgi:hypothetical protein